MSNTSPTYDYLADLFIGLVDLFKPPERITVADAAEKYIFLNNPGSYVGPYRNSFAPYMVEPQNELASRLFESLIFAGPAQAAKTQALILNFYAYNVVVDPMDMIIYSPTQSAANDFSVRRVDRMNRVCPLVGSALLQHRDADNVYQKRFKSGMIVSLGWPTVSQFAGKPVGRIFLTDYDRMDDNIEGDGSAYDLAAKRATTFGSFRMVVAESSPSRPLETTKFVATSPHEAPPTKGILSLYNRGDRRRYYWPCPHCMHFFEGNFRHLKWEKRGNILDSAATVKMICPACAEEIEPDDRKLMFQMAVWLKDGQHIEDNEVRGEARRSKIASFWLNGVAAAFVSWSELVEIYLNAEEEQTRTGSDDALRKFYNNDLAEPYIPKALELERLPEVLKARAEKLPEREVPADVRFLIATVDVQKNAFAVMVTGILPGAPFDMVVVDRFDIFKSDREDADGERLWVKPATYLEDWNVLRDRVIKASYPLSDGSGRRMQIKLTLCDSGGRAGVTPNAYNFWRAMKKESLSSRFYLVKGDPGPNRPRVTIEYPDSNRKDRNSGARGDVPVLFFNSNLLKDDLNGRLDCVEPGKGMYRTPDWLGDSFYVEMCAESREPKGWAATGKLRNESWDLSYYAIGGCISPLVGVERIQWENPAKWASPWDTNDLVFKPEDKERFARSSAPLYDLAALAKVLA